MPKSHGIQLVWRSIGMHEVPINQVQEGKSEIIWFWIYSGDVHPRTCATIQLSLDGSGFANTQRSTFAQMGRFDATTWGQLTNVIPSRIFWMAALVANHGRWLGVQRDGFLRRSRSSTPSREIMDRFKYKITFCLFIFLSFFYICV